MLNAQQHYQTVKFWTPWVAATARLRLAVLRPAVRRGTLVGALVLLSLSYVWQANGSAAANVEIRSLRSQAAELAAEHSRLERQAVELRSLQRVSESTAKLGLVALPGQQFARSGAGLVAVAP